MKILALFLSRCLIFSNTAICSQLGTATSVGSFPQVFKMIISCYFSNSAKPQILQIIKPSQPLPTLSPPPSATLSRSQWTLCRLRLSPRRHLQRWDVFSISPLTITFMSLLGIGHVTNPMNYGPAGRQGGGQGHHKEVGGTGGSYTINQKGQWIRSFSYKKKML